MTCPKCGSENVNVQLINEIELKTKHRGVIWWICVGWWWLPIKWCCFTLIALIVKLFRPKRYKTINKSVAKCVCQDCGYVWQTEEMAAQTK
jgi:hypothetical protein